MQETIECPKISLRAARVNAGLSISDVAKALGVSKNTVINYEHGRTAPSYAVVQKLETLYKYPMRYIFFPDA